MQDQAIAHQLQLTFDYLQQQTITLEELSENSAIAAAIYAKHLEQQWWNLQRYPISFILWQFI